MDPKISSRSLRGSEGSNTKDSWPPILRCKNCDRPLSVGPIYITSDNELNICGRCKNNSETGTIIRNKAYEEIALNQVFPCAHEGCNDVIPWTNVTQHEINCIFKPKRCVIENCDWKGIENDRINHFKNDHTIIFFDLFEKIELDLTENQNLTLLTFNFKVIIDFDVKNGELKITLFYLGSNLSKILIKGVAFIIEDKYNNKIQKTMFFVNQAVLSTSSTFENIFSYLMKPKISCNFILCSTDIRLKSDILEIYCNSCNNLITDYVYIHNLNKNRIHCKNCKSLGSQKIPYHSYCKLPNVENENSDDFVNCPHTMCFLKVKKENVEDHANKCLYKLFKCQKCTFENDFYKVKQHYIHYHSAMTDNKHFWTTKNDFGIETVQIVLNNTIFHIKKTRQRNNGMFDFDKTCYIQFEVDLETIVSVFENETNKYCFRIELLHKKSNYFNLIIGGIKQESSLIGKICVDNSILHEYRNEDDTYTFKITITSF